MKGTNWGALLTIREPIVAFGEKTRAFSSL